MNAEDPIHARPEHREGREPVTTGPSPDAAAARSPDAAACPPDNARETDASVAPELAVEGLVVTAGTFRLEVDLSCRIWPLVLLGPSGAGKSMFLRALSGLAVPEKGSIRLGGDVWVGGDPGARRFVPPHARSVGVCLQDPLLFPHRNVRENVAFPLGAVRPRLSRAARRAGALAELERWGAAALAEAAVERLSGGEQRRVGLARAFVRRPALLLLDEPLAALDPPSRDALLSEVRRELAARSRPAVWVTHDRAEAAMLGGTLAVLLGGRIAQTGPAEEVFRRPSSPEVSSFVGTGTILHGFVQAREAGVMRVIAGPIALHAVGSLNPGTPVVISIRSEEVDLLSAGGDARDGHEVASARNELPATVVSVRPIGLAFVVELDAGVPLAASVTRPAVQELALAPGRRVRARIKALAIQVRSESWNAATSPAASDR